MKRLSWVVTLLTMFIAVTAQVPVKEPAPKKEYKNVVRYNLSGPLLFGFNYAVFGYERVLKSNQSISMNIGQASLPKIISFQSNDASLSGDQSKSGFNVSVDYRFYLKKENKFRAPRGVYIGPYYSYNNFGRNSNWRIDDNGSMVVANTKANFSIHTIGAEVGYQFVLGKRFTIDLVMVGPGMGNYKMNIELSDGLTPEQKEKLLAAVQDILTQKFPGMDFALSDVSLSTQGKLNTWNLGYRYIIHVGFRF